MSDTLALILAAGEGTRMKSGLSKVLHPVCGRPLIDWALHAAAAVDPQPVVIVGYGRDRVMEHLQGRARFAVQAEQLGTGHAVMMAREYLQGFRGAVVVMAGDMPLIRGETIRALVERVEAGAAVALLSAMAEEPFGYGRILRDGTGAVRGIVEERDATDAQRAIREVNASVYAFRCEQLLSVLDQLTANNAQRQYYLTDAVHMLIQKGERAEVLTLSNMDQCAGINDRLQLAEADRAMRLRINGEHMQNGVTIIDPYTTYIGPDVTIDRDAVIYPGNVLEGHTAIGPGAVLYPNNRLVDATVGAGSTVESSLLERCTVGENVTIGPNAHLRPGAQLADRVRVGNFVEIKNATVGAGSKVSHLTYVGDGDVGAGVNVGCGVVFVNYDGASKHRSTVGDNVFIGCNTNLVAPVQVGDGAYIAAGTTVTEDIPADALCIGRSRQSVKPGWAKTRKERSRQ